MAIRVAIPIPNSKKDVKLAHALLSLLAQLEEGVKDVEYYLVCDEPVCKALKKICSEFLKRKNGCVFPSGLSRSALKQVSGRIGVPPRGDALNRVHSRYLPWNVVVDKLVREVLPGSDFLLLLEPDACIMQDEWLTPIVDEVHRAPEFQPIVGHIKEGIIGGERVMTHWAGCSCYRPNLLEAVGVDDLLSALVPNPWYQYKETLGSFHPNIWQHRNEIGARYCSLDLVFYVMFWYRRTGSADFNDWRPEELLQSSTIHCACGTTESWYILLPEYFNRISVFHQQKSPKANLEMLRLMGGKPLPA